MRNMRTIQIIVIYNWQNTPFGLVWYIQMESGNGWMEQKWII